MNALNVFIVIIVIISVFLTMPSVKGKIGEAKVAFLLERLDKNTYIVFNDLLVPKANGKTTQIDHVVISVYGIFVIETKNYKGWIFGNEKNKYWTQQIYQRKERFYNPVWQNFGHIKSLETILGEFSNSIYSIVTFSGKATLKKISVSSPYVHIINSIQVVKTIKNYQKKVLSNSDVQNVVNHLNNLGNNKESAKRHVKQIKETQKQIKNKVKSNICPRCGGGLVQRKGKYGSFAGCSNFPKCRFVSS
ncbi:NERD domain-containing protein [Salirhabdus sp. Marseille-P4669]|uniref:NERD domain-containing protein n=1 Tax=Salirhabdus sp. Marseille-P4669 TaxID=2042310 RepID=UPI001F29CE10|nr:NERD domain-containing protein [Salirhabdus sp. Marseille-P4669]